MAVNEQKQTAHSAIPYIAPFAAFTILLGLRSSLSLSPGWEYPLQVIVVSVIVILVSLPTISRRIERPFASITVGLVVFLIWIAPDSLWPQYRHFFLFENSVMGSAKSSLPLQLHSDAMFLFFRILGTAVLVPIIEELFWRGWMMRYLVNADFEKVPLGTYSASAFWITALLFATEHGSYWDVGLLAGLIYNSWMLRTRNLTDCMLAHAVTNACLAIYAVGFGHWEYWL